MNGATRTPLLLSQPIRAIRILGTTLSAVVILNSRQITTTSAFNLSPRISNHHQSSTRCAVTTNHHPRHPNNNGLRTTNPFSIISPFYPHGRRPIVTWQTAKDNEQEEENKEEFPSGVVAFESEETTDEFPSGVVPFESNSENDDDEDSNEATAPPMTTDSDDDLPITRSEMEQCTVAQLRQQLRHRGKKVGGNKAELVDRILGLEEAAANADDTTSSEEMTDEFPSGVVAFESNSETASVPSSSSSNVIESKITIDDYNFMQQALTHAQKGKGNTYPNPAVGCVIVASNHNHNNADDDDESTEPPTIIGAGFHPKAGYPHAEIFALLEAYGHLPNGVDAAHSIVTETRPTTTTTDDENNNTELVNRVNELCTIYKSPTGPAELFDNPSLLQKITKGHTLTAYVTLEPCCHEGLTPPCAAALLRAGVGRVVVGLRDPNPRVDGGGVRLLEGEGVVVDVMVGSGSGSEEDGDKGEEEDDETENEEEEGNVSKENKVANQCEGLVKSFVKRISPRQTAADGMGLTNYDETVNGAKRAAIRSLAGKWKNDKTLSNFAWQARYGSIDNAVLLTNNESLEEAIAALAINHRWLEKIDDALWEKELVLIRLTAAVAKKKGVKILGARLADELGAHVAQVVGHTVLLYRPGFPPVLDLDRMVEDRAK